MAGETVLIVEDRRENIVHLANNILKPNGYEVITAMDGRRGLKRISQDNPDLVILDLNMPRMDGLEVLAALKEQNIDVPVILTTFYGSEQVAEQALELGASAYVVKPYEAAEMLAAIDKALSQRRIRTAVQSEKLIEPTMPLTRQLERWMRDMNILTRVGKALVAILDQDRIHTRAVEAAIYVTRADYGFLYLLDEGGDKKLYLRALRGPQDPRAYGLEKLVTSGLALQVAQAGEVLRAPNTSGDATIFEIIGEALGPAAAAPITWRKQLLGVLMVARSHGEAGFGESDEEWLGGLADYVAIAVSNATAVKQRGDPATPDSDTIAALRQKTAELSGQLQAAAGTARKLAVLLGGAAPASDRDPEDPPTNAV